MTRLILHVGSHKTGTTQIQSHLFAARRALRRDGVVYDPASRRFGLTPSAMHGLVSAIAGGDAKAAHRAERHRDRLLRRAGGGGTVVVSSERLWRVTDGGGYLGEDGPAARAAFLRRFRDWCAPFHAVPLAVLRRPDSFAMSLYKSAVAGDGTTMDLEGWLGRRRAVLDYSARIADWQGFDDPPVLVRFEDVAGPRLAETVMAAVGIRLPPTPISMPRRPGLSDRATLWMLRARSETQPDRWTHRARWRFATAGGYPGFASDEPTTLWPNAQTRDDVFRFATKDLPFGLGWDAPGPLPKPAVWSDEDHAAAEAAFARWRLENRHDLYARDVVRAFPFAGPEAVPPLRGALLRGISRLLGPVGLGR